MNNLIFVLIQKTQSNSDNVSGAALSIEQSAYKSIFSSLAKRYKRFYIAFWHSEKQWIWNWIINTLKILNQMQLLQCSSTTYSVVEDKWLG